MRIRHFLNRVEHERVHQAIQKAERGTSGRIVVYLSHHWTRDALGAAHKAFVKLKLETPTEKTGLLIFLAPKTQKFAVVGGTALHEKLGQAWWDRLAGIITGHFKEGRFTDGLLAAVEEASQALQIHFPEMRTRYSAQDDIIEG
jgi:uncharacterized membrane protein